MTQKITTTILQRRTLKMAVALCSSSFMLTACGGAFSNVPSTVAPSNSATSTGGPGTATQSAAWTSLNMNGTVSGGRFSNQKVLSIDKAGKNLLLSLPLPPNPYVDGANVSLPLTQLPGASVNLQPIQGGGSSLVLTIPLAAIMKKTGVQTMPSTKLPNGDPLPAVAAGQLPAFAVQLPNINGVTMTVYMDVSQVGIYVNTPFDPMIQLSFAIMSDDNTRTWGYLTSVPAKNKVDGGFFISVQIPDDLARIIDDNI